MAVLMAGGNMDNGEGVSQASSEVDEGRSRSVNDFDTDAALKRALQDGKKRSSFVSWTVSDAQGLGGLAEADFDDDDDFDSELEELLNDEHDPSLDWVISNLDKETSVEQSLDEELNRLKVLRSYLILDSEREGSFERLTALASRMFNVPIALISLVDLGRQWFMSNRGLGNVRETPRKLAFCAHAILSTQDLLIVTDATKDSRFYDSPLVLGSPNIRFYAGAPLISPEGVKLGTFCIIDSKTRPEGLSLVGKQNLRELAAMVIDTMVERRKEKQNSVEDRSKQIACTAHDLLTPLSGVQMSVSLLLEDSDFMNKLDEGQKELIETAVNCSDVMSRICHETIETFRGDLRQQKESAQARRVSLGGMESATNKQVARNLRSGQKAINLATLVKNITMVMDPYPKEVPLYITTDPKLPKEFISDDLKVFRSIINYLTNACKHTEKGCVHLKIFKADKHTNRKKKKAGKANLVFEVEDTGKGIKLEQYSSLFRPFRDNESGVHEPDNCISVDAQGNFSQSGALCTPEMETPGLGLYSVATNIGSIGGEYGFRPREVSDDDPHANRKTGSVFWFSVPLVEPDASEQLPNQEFEGNDIPNVVVNQHGEPVLSIPSNSIKRVEHATNTKPTKPLIKVVVCDALPEDAMSIPAPPPKNGRKARKLCAGTWNDETLGSIHVDNRPQEPSTLPKLKEKTDEKGKVYEGSKRNSYKVLSTSNMNDEATSQVIHTISHALNDENGHTSTAEIKKSGNTNTEAFVAQGSLLNVSAGDTFQRKRKALVIDDSLVIRKSIGRALTTMGFEVSQATNGMEGLKLLQSAIFDVVLCDFLMPVMDGLDCVQQYRSWEESHRPDLRQFIVGISAHANPRDVERGIECGMNSFFSKPLPIKVLREIQQSDDFNEMSSKLDKLCLNHEIPLTPTKGQQPSTTNNGETDQTTPANKSGDESNSALEDNTEQDESRKPICLIAEDSKTVSKVLKRAIEGRGWRTSMVEDGDEALRLLKTRNWDAVFLDDEMPKMNGSQCLERFRAWEKRNRVATQKNVVFMSGNYIPPPPGAETSCMAYPKGFDGAIPKPVVLKDLYSLLQNAATSDERKSSDIMHR